MTTIPNGRSSALTGLEDRTTHSYRVGDLVRLKGGFVQHPHAAGAYRITATLPPDGTFPQYRVRNEDERHERVVAQDNLERVRADTRNERSKLISKTFGDL